MKKTLDSAKKVLIVLPAKLNVDIASAAFALAFLLKGDKKLTLASENKIPREIKKIIDISDFEIKHKLSKREVVLSINRKKGKVEAVRWREIDEKVQFIITPSENDFEFDDVDLQTSGSNYDLIVTVGLQQLSDAGTIYENHKDVFKNIKILNIDSSKNNKKFGTVDKVSEGIPLSTHLLDLYENEEIAINKEAAETLFKGIFWSNEGFRSDNSIDRAVKTLIGAGGQLSKTVASMFDALTVKELRYIGKMISNLTANSDGIVYSKIPHQDTMGINLERVIYPEINLISRLKRYKVAIVITEYQRGKMHVRIYSNDKDSNLFEKYSSFSPVGNARKVSFYTEGDFGNIERNILEKLIAKEKSESKEIKQDNEEEIKKEASKDKEESSPLPSAETLPDPEEEPENNQQQVPFQPMTPPPPQSYQPVQPPMQYPTGPLPPAQQ